MFSVIVPLIPFLDTIKDNKDSKVIFDNLTFMLYLKNKYHKGCSLDVICYIYWSMSSLCQNKLVRYNFKRVETLEPAKPNPILIRQ